MDEVERGTPEDALTEGGREVALSYPAAVLALLVGLGGRRVREVARALAIRPEGTREDVAMRVAGEVARTTEGIHRLVKVLETSELRRTCDEVIGLPALGGRLDLVWRLERWLSLYVAPDDEAPSAPEALIAGRWRLGALREAVGAGTLHDVVDVRLGGRPPAVALVAHLPSDVALEAEVLVGLRLTHPAIVRVLDHGIDGEGRDVAILDDPGTPLLRWLAEGGPAPVGLATRQTLALAAALDHAHVCGVLHGALDASCVWVDRAERVRLSGFGRVVDGSAGRGSEPASEAGRTKVDGSAGRGSEPASEAGRTKVDDEAVTAASDQRALARLFLTLVSGQAGGPPALDRLHAPVAAALRRALSETPAERFATCLDLALALIGAECA